MTSAEIPVGACGDTAPTGDRTVSRHDHEVWCDEVVQWAHRFTAVKVSLEVLLSALEGGDEWEIATARRLAGRTLHDHEGAQ